MGSSPDEVDFFNWPNPSSRTMFLGSTHPLTEMSTRNIPGGGGGVKGVARKADESHRYPWANCLENMGASMACYRDSFTFFPYLGEREN
jgi:hypothetical protein